MNGWQLFYELTVQLVKLFQDGTDPDERVAEMERLLAARDEAVSKVTKPVTDADHELVKKCKQLNDHLTMLMQQEKLNIQKELKQLKVKKQSTNKYVNPYNQVNTDGIFYDKRK